MQDGDSPLHVLSAAASHNVAMVQAFANLSTVKLDMDRLNSKAEHKGRRGVEIAKVTEWPSFWLGQSDCSPVDCRHCWNGRQMSMHGTT